MKFIPFILFVLLLWNCKKDPKIALQDSKIKTTVKPDWNDNIVGKYPGVWKLRQYGMGQTYPTNYLIDTVVVTKGINEFDVKIFMRGSTTPWLVAYDTLINSYSFYHGGLYFYRDTFSFNHMSGGLGGGIYENFIGKKQ